MTNATRAAAAFWRELAYELRRRAGDERLPAPLRARLRDATHRAAARSGRLLPSVERYPRRRLREAMNAPRGTAAGPGDGRPTALVAVRRAPDTFAPALAFLHDAGYQVVDTTAPDTDALTAARVVITDAADVQRAATAAGTALLVVNADDVFSGYPVHPQGVYALRHAVDLDTGRRIPLGERLGEGYYRNLRNIGFRQLSAAEILDAVRELHAGVTGGWVERDSQRRFRERAAAASEAIAGRVPAAALWGADDGFIGDGRLAAFQAEDAP
jgi:hypothetical protein